MPEAGPAEIGVFAGGAAEPNAAEGLCWMIC